MDYGKFEKGLFRLEEAAWRERGNIREMVHELVPEYHYKPADPGKGEAAEEAAAEAAAGLDPGMEMASGERLALHRRLAMYSVWSNEKQGKQE